MANSYQVKQVYTVKLLVVALWLAASTPLLAQHYDFIDPVRLGNTVNTPDEESKPILSPKGDQLFFVRTLSETNTGGIEGGQDIWVSQRVGNSWSSAVNVISQLNNPENNSVIGTNGSGDRL